VLTFSIAIAILGIVGIFLPTALLAISRPLLTACALRRIDPCGARA